MEWIERWPIKLCIARTVVVHRRFLGPDSLLVIILVARRTVKSATWLAQLSAPAKCLGTTKEEGRKFIEKEKEDIEKETHTYYAYSTVCVYLGLTQLSKAPLPCTYRIFPARVYVQWRKYT